jgi:uncharacterized protein YkwD
MRIFKGLWPPVPPPSDPAQKTQHLGRLVRIAQVGFFTVDYFDRSAAPTGAVTPAPSAPTGPAPISPLTGGPSDAFLRRIYERVNFERARVGVPPLVYDPTLERTADAHSQVMATNDKLSHDGLGDGSSYDRISAAGPYSFTGENLATVLSTDDFSADDVVARWMASPGHRANLLDPQYNRTGLGIEGRYLTMDFGSLR